MEHPAEVLRGGVRYPRAFGWRDNGRRDFGLVILTVIDSSARQMVAPFVPAHQPEVTVSPAALASIPPCDDEDARGAHRINWSAFSPVLPLAAKSRARRWSCSRCLASWPKRCRGLPSARLSGLLETLAVPPDACHAE
jgi:hypothetical protein